MTTPLRWRIETMRIVAVCGDLPVGAIFPPARGLRCRWRAFLTVNMNPAEGTAKNDAVAKREVETRWAALLEKAKLRPIEWITPETILEALRPKEETDGEA